MRYLLVVLLYLSVISLSWSTLQEHLLRNYSYNFVGQYQNDVYFIRGNIKRKIPTDDNWETFKHLGFQQKNIVNLTDQYYSHLIHGANIDPIHLENEGDLDDIMRVVLKANNALQGRLIKHKTLLGPSENPSVIAFQGRLMQFVGLAYHGEVIVAKWLDTYQNGTKIPAHEQEFLGFNTTTFRSIEIMGMDVRALKIDDTRFNLVFTNRFVQPRVRMGVAEVALDDTRQKLIIKSNYQQLYWTSKQSEKNWSPFLFAGGTYLIQSLNPFHVVGYTPIDPQAASVISSSRASFAHTSYRFGDLRGGSNAIDLGDCYLSFFHSVVSLNNMHKTYFMGAYTFTKTSPWHLLGVSPEPLLDDTFYTGPWVDLGRNRPMNYVVFPMSLYRDEWTPNVQDIGDLVLTVGVGDKEGWMLRFDSTTLLRSLQPVVYCDQDHYPRAIKAMYCSQAPLTEPPPLHLHALHPRNASNSSGSGGGQPFHHSHHSNSNNNNNPHPTQTTSTHRVLKKSPI